LTSVLAPPEERLSRNLRFSSGIVTDGDTADPALATSNVEIAYVQIVDCVTTGIALAMGLDQIAHDNTVVSAGTCAKEGFSAVCCSNDGFECQGAI
jgi:hypothetical protein